MSDPPSSSPSAGDGSGYCCPIPVETSDSGSQQNQYDLNGKTCPGERVSFETCTQERKHKLWSPTQLQCDNACAGCKVCEAIENGDESGIPPSYRETFRAVGGKLMSRENLERFCKQFPRCKVVQVKIGDASNSISTVRCEPKPSAGCPVYFCDRKKAAENMTSGSASQGGRDYCQMFTSEPTGDIAREFGYIDQDKCGEQCNRLSPSLQVVPPPSTGGASTSRPTSGGPGPASASAGSQGKQYYCCGMEGSLKKCLAKPQSIDEIRKTCLDPRDVYEDSTCGGTNCQPPTPDPSPPFTPPNNRHCCYYSDGTPVGCMLRYVASLQGQDKECLDNYDGKTTQEAMALCQSVCPPPDSSASSISSSSSSTSAAPVYCCYWQGDKPTSCLLRPVHEGAKCTGNYADPLVCAATEKCPPPTSSTSSSSSKSSMSSSSSSSNTSEKKAVCCERQGSTPQCSEKPISQCQGSIISPAYKDPMAICKNDVCVAAEARQITYSCSTLKEACQTQCPVISIFGITIFNGCMGSGGEGDNRCPSELCAKEDFAYVSGYSCDVKPEVCEEQGPTGYCLVNGQCVPSGEGMVCGTVYTSIEACNES